jgi:transmembrane sensor
MERQTRQGSGEQGAADAEWAGFEWAARAGAVDAVLEGLHRKATMRRRRRVAAVAAASLAALVVATGLGLRGQDRGETLAHERDPPLIKIMEPERQTLPDGSTVLLRDNASLAVNYGAQQRRIVLVAGAAHFEVMKDASRPFVVVAGGTEVRAVGTAFTVEQGASEVTVVVTHGTVAVNRDGGSGQPGAQPVLVSAGRAVQVHSTSGSGTEPLAVVELKSAEFAGSIAWQIPRFEFSGSSLGDVVATFNRYNDVRLVIEDEALRDLRLSGVMRADRIDELVRMLEANLPVRARRREGEIILSGTK